MSKKDEEYKKVKKELRAYSRSIFFKNFFKKKHHRKHEDAPDISTITEHLAFVIDGEVAEVMHCQPKLAAILLSNPEIVNIPEGIYPKPGFKYINNTFIE